ncbi:MAG: polysaccharide pyruvyl transferase family protein [Deltaproteobacteria bacterium]|jgi:polysaccharide pyruvyl transferase WcaK-like protein|nr:polysaccharide pyruvyl transferase family protein [Deltaproteobacteria bacterium]
MNILLANDTSGFENIGCQAAMRGLAAALAHLSAAVTSMPWDYWSEYFRDGAYNYARWEAARLNALRTDPGIVSLFARHNAFWVNGEGSIHHNLPRALALLALIKSAARQGTPTALINCTLDGMHTDIVHDALRKTNFIHTREPYTHALLKNLNINSFLAPDIAVMGIRDAPAGYPAVKEARSCMITFGIHHTLGTAHVAEKLDTIFNTVKDFDLLPVYLSIDMSETSVIKEICESSNVPLIEAWTFPLDSIPVFMRQFTCAISGRHHVNIFLLKAGIPFAALPSNTYKIQGTLDLFNLRGNYVEETEKLASVLISICKSSETYTISEEYFDKYKKRTVEIFETYNFT